VSRRIEDLLRNRDKDLSTQQTDCLTLLFVLGFVQAKAGFLPLPIDLLPTSRLDGHFTARRIGPNSVVDNSPRDILLLY